jgi:hypothetical protein
MRGQVVKGCTQERGRDGTGEWKVEGASGRRSRASADPGETEKRRESRFGVAWVPIRLARFDTCFSVPLIHCLGSLHYD